MHAAVIVSCKPHALLLIQREPFLRILQGIIALHGLSPRREFGKWYRESGPLRNEATARFFARFFLIRRKFSVRCSISGRAAGICASITGSEVVPGRHRTSAIADVRIV